MSKSIINLKEIFSGLGKATCLSSIIMFIFIFINPTKYLISDEILSSLYYAPYLLFLWLSGGNIYYTTRILIGPGPYLVDFFMLIFFIIFTYFIIFSKNIKNKKIAAFICFLIYFLFYIYYLYPTLMYYFIADRIEGNIGIGTGNFHVLFFDLFYILIMFYLIYNMKTTKLEYYINTILKYLFFFIEGLIAVIVGFTLLNTIGKGSNGLEILWVTISTLLFGFLLFFIVKLLEKMFFEDEKTLKLLKKQIKYLQNISSSTKHIHL